jgi:hypothetical protein
LSPADEGHGQTPAHTAPATPTNVLTLKFPRALRDSLTVLPHQLLIEGSDTIQLGTGIRLVRNTDYRIDYRWGIIRFDSAAVEGKARGAGIHPDHLTVSYAYLPFRFKESYSRRQLTVLRDTTRGDTIRVARPSAPLNVESLFGPNLQKSGSLVRGFTVGSNRDLSLTSGLRLQLSGQLASDIEIAAALSDENTPIQPEGTTQSLQEFDKVFVEIKSPNLGATLGDYYLSLTGSEFARMNRKVQGARGTGQFKSGATDGSALVSGAVTRGKFNTNQFNGIEGVQGPYRLTDRDGKSFIIVLAGTERVYVDGIRQSRGETNDYTIDYSSGELTFTPRRLITSASRIVVDFEYTDQQYARSLIATQGEVGLFDDKARLSVTYLREADDYDAPIDFTITDSMRTILQNAGGDQSKAVISGVTQVDSNGLYVRVDTVLSTGQPKEFYRYAPGDPEAKYRITFSYAGSGKGEYIRQVVGIFVWKGPVGGDYLPVVYLPFPQLHQVADVALSLHPAGELTVGGEYARSTYNANRFSLTPDSRQDGNAFTLTAGYAPKSVRIGQTDIGGFDIRLRERHVDEGFVFIDRTNDIEFNRKWGIDTVLSAKEDIREGSLKYLPATGISVGTGYGKISRGDTFSSTRVEGFTTLQNEQLPTGTYSVEDIRSSDLVTDNATSWFRQKGYLQYTFARLTPVARIETEDKEISGITVPGLRSGSYRFGAYSGGLTAKDLGRLTLSAEYQWRTDDKALGGVLTRESSSLSQFYTARLAEWNALTSTLEVTLRSKTYTEEFKQLGNPDVKTVLVRDRTRFTPLNQGVDLDIFYEVQTERASRLQRVFVKVAPGQGTYRYLGDLNNNGVADESEFAQVRFDGDFVVVTLPTDQLFPTIDLKTSARLRLIPQKFLSAGSTVADILSVITSDTYARVDERSTDPELQDIYFLHFSKFQQDSTTVSGSSLFTQDLLFFDGKPDFSSRLRYSQRRGLTNYAGGPERTYNRELSARLRWQLVPELANQIDLGSKTDRLTSVIATSRLHDVLTNSLAMDFAYRPEQNMELGFTVSVSRSEDRLPQPDTRADMNSQSIRWIFAFQGAGQARIAASREEVGLNLQQQQSYPYELTGGRVPGKTWLWGGSLDYRLASFIQATVSYEGRSEGGAPPVHTARAEVRAFF